MALRIRPTSKARLAQTPSTRWWSRFLPRARPFDVYLQPHSDDICFSLGALAHHRRRGQLLTAFSVSIYVARERRQELSTKKAVTAARLAEDANFARTCGLSTRSLACADALTGGIDPWNLGRVGERTNEIEAALLGALSATPCKGGDERPWLFCPSGIGGHVDHVAVLKVIARHYLRFADCYRIGFYEDQPYASQAKARIRGLDRFFQMLHDRRLNRHAWALGETMETKLRLVRLYKSQFDILPSTAEEFTPAAESPIGPHEAVWSEECTSPNPLGLSRV